MRSAATSWSRSQTTGRASPPTCKSRIFEPFFTTKPVGEGTGLGLDVARRIVIGHRGAIAVRSQPGATVFSVTIPAAGREHR